MPGEVNGKILLERILKICKNIGESGSVQVKKGYMDRECLTSIKRQDTVICVGERDLADERINVLQQKI